MFSLSIKPSTNPYRITQNILKSYKEQLKPLKKTQLLIGNDSILVSGDSIFAIFSTVKLSEIKEISDKRAELRKTPGRPYISPKDVPFLLSGHIVNPNDVRFCNTSIVMEAFYNFENRMSLISSLEELKPAWEIISNKNIDDAISIMTVEEDNFYRQPKSSFDISGIKIGSDYLFLFAPLLILIIQLYFYSLVVHLIEIPKTEIDVAIKFPWFPLFANDLGIILTILSVAVLPIVSTIMVLFNSNISTWYKLGLIALAIVVFVISGLKTLNKVSVFHEMVKGAKNRDVMKDTEQA
jgi:hypothetical protein